MFSVFVIFIFSILTFHPALKVIDKDGSIGIVLMVSELVSIIFSFVFILYSVGSFLRNRSRQFAVINIIGSTKKQFNRIVFYENSIISILSLISGVTLGLIFSKFFLMFAERIIDGLVLNFYMPFKALFLTIFLMGGMFSAISLIAPIMLRRKKIIELLKKEDEAEKDYLFMVLIVSLIIIPITVYFHIQISMLVYPMYLVSFICLGYLGLDIIYRAYYFFMKKSNRLYKGKNLINISNFRYKINTNLKTMTISLVLFSIVLSAFVYIVGAPGTVKETVDRVMPYSYMYATWNDEVNPYERAEQIEDKLKDEDGFDKLELQYLKMDEKHNDAIISNSIYNKVADFLNYKKVQLRSDEHYMVGTDGKNIPVMGEKLGENFRTHGITKSIGYEEKLIALSGYFTSATVVSDEQYQKLSSIYEKDQLFAYNIDNWETNKNKEDEIRELIKNDENSESVAKETIATAYRYYYVEKLTKNISAYVGSILCISFLIGIASIVYSRLYTSAQEEIAKYRTMVKIGITEKEVRGLLSSTVKWIFVLPFLVALIISWMIIIEIDKHTLIPYMNVAVKCSVLYLFIELVLYTVINKKYQEKIIKALF